MLLWLAGWSGLLNRLRDDPISRTILKMKGVGVAVSAILAPLGTAYGVWTVNHSAPAASVAALMVFVLVMVADRYFVFSADVQSKVKWTGRFRVPLALAIAALTSFAAFVDLNYDHLQAVASDMLLERSAERQAAINNATGLQDLRGAEVKASARISALRELRLNLPEDIQKQKAEAAVCARSVDGRLDQLLSQGVSRRNASASVASARQRCNQQIRRAADTERIYLGGIDADLDLARNAAANAAGELEAAVTEKVDLAQKSTAIDAQAFKPASLAVVWRYLSQNPLAIIELLVIYAGIAVCDAAGLLIASIVGRSPAGWKFERDYLCELAPLMADRANAHQQILQVESLIRQTTKAAKKDQVLTDIREKFVEVQKTMTSANARATRNAAPLLAVAASINTMISTVLDAEKAARRAHEVSPALGRAADRKIINATKESFGGLEA